MKDACEHITDEQLQELKKANTEFKKVLDGDDIIACVHADMKFHEIIYGAVSYTHLDVYKRQILRNPCRGQDLFVQFYRPAPEGLLYGILRL